MLLCVVWRCESCLWPIDSGKVNIKENLVTESIHLKHEERGRNNKQSRKSPFLLLKYVPTKQLVNGIKMLEERIDIYIRAKRRYISKVSSYKWYIFIRTEFVHTFLKQWPINGWLNLWKLSKSSTFTVIWLFLIPEVLTAVEYRLTSRAFSAQQPQP